MVVLSAAQRKALRSRAHRLHPVVAIGDNGLTDAALREIDTSLRSHELIKVRVAVEGRQEREACLARICEALNAAPVQHIGKILVIWRRRPATDTQPTPDRAP
jgi:putative YhbY family RNA-binding protein